MRRLRPRFWLAFWWQTLTTPDLLSLVALRLRGETIARVEGSQHLPPEGLFVLAVNHFNGRPALDLGAVVLHAVARVRPDAARNMLFIVGQRQPRRRTLLWRISGWVQQRWGRHLLRIAWRNDQPSVQGLRAWQQRGQPVFVFPEGRGQRCFGELRPGAGRWLSRSPMPVIPVAAWWERDTGWRLCFGPGLRWAARDELRDVQLGLAIAALLPPELAPDWQELLARWYAVHTGEA